MRFQWIPYLCKQPPLFQQHWWQTTWLVSCWQTFSSKPFLASVSTEELCQPSKNDITETTVISDSRHHQQLWQFRCNCRVTLWEVRWGGHWHLLQRGPLVFLVLGWTPHPHQISQKSEVSSGDGERLSAKWNTIKLTEMVYWLAALSSSLMESVTWAPWLVSVHCTHSSFGLAKEEKRLQTNGVRGVMVLRLQQLQVWELDHLQSEVTPHTLS